MAKVLCVLYPDPETGYPPRYARDSIPVISGYANGQMHRIPKNSDSSQANWSVRFPVSSV
jgi:formate dehydrogenase